MSRKRKNQPVEYRPDINSSYVTSDMEFDGGIIGNPKGFRFATGRENVDVRGAGVEMLRGRHERCSYPRDEKTEEE
jgi:hypothetical protein